MVRELTQFEAHFEPVLSREEHVDEDQVGPVRAELLDALVAVHRDRHGEPVRGEVIREHARVHRVVFDHEDPPRGFVRDLLHSKDVTPVLEGRPASAERSPPQSG